MCIGRVTIDNDMKKLVEEIGVEIVNLRASLVAGEDCIVIYGRLYAAHYILAQKIKHKEELEDEAAKLMKKEGPAGD